MMITEYLNENICCGIADKRHVAENPIKLTCGHVACDSCFNKYHAGKCKICDKENQTSRIYNFPAKSIDKELKRYIEDLFPQMEEKFRTNIKKLKGISRFY